jgi:hypothetical protein
VARRSADRQPGADVDLVPLDPVTGASLGADGTPAGAAAAEGLDRDVDIDVDVVDRARRARRLRRVAAVSAGISFAAAVMAGWFVLSIRDLQSIERTWRTGLAIDEARESADRSIRLLAPGETEAVRQPLDEVGDEEASRLEALERRLDHRRILDPKVSKLRDEMIGALRFRRFQMTPERLQLGRTPIDRVEAVLDDQLDRWGLHATYVEPPPLHAFDDALSGLRNYASQPTATMLAALTSAGDVVDIDVDRSTSRTRADAATSEAEVLVPVAGGAVALVTDGDISSPTRAVVVVDRNGVTRATVDLRGREVVAGGGGVLWLVGAADIRRAEARDPADVIVGQGFPIPTNRTVVGATRESVILGRDQPDAGLERWVPATGTITSLTTTRARFLAANEDLVLWQGPLDFSDTGNGGFLHLLHLDTGKHDLIGLARTDAASAAISPDGRTIAVAAGPLAGRLGSVLTLEVGTTALQGTPGPRVAVDGPALTWSSDSRTLFWRTPDGELAVRHAPAAGDAPLTEVLRTGLSDLTAVAVTDGR